MYTWFLSYFKSVGVFVHFEQNDFTLKMSNTYIERMFLTFIKRTSYVVSSVTGVTSVQFNIVKNSRG